MLTIPFGKYAGTKLTELPPYTRYLLLFEGDGLTEEERDTLAASLYLFVIPPCIGYESNPNPSNQERLNTITTWFDRPKGSKKRPLPTDIQKHVAAQLLSEWNALIAFVAKWNRSHPRNLPETANMAVSGAE